MTEFLGAGALYALLALDHIAVGQFMVSRPLVVGPVIGWFWGDPAMGLFAGVIVEFLWVHVIPVGLWPIDTSAVTALAVTWGALSDAGRPGLVVALALAVPFGILIRWGDIWTRRQNSRLIPWVAERVSRGQSGALPLSLVLSLAGWFAKALIIFALLAPSGQAATSWLVSICPRKLVDALDWTGRLLPFLALTAVLNYFLDRSRLHFSWSDRPPKT
jgi:mannose/fructose/N-acetylgalactosamine-specific phosphotransferase system component IIC